MLVTPSVSCWPTRTLAKAAVAAWVALARSKAAPVTLTVAGLSVESSRPVPVSALDCRTSETSVPVMAPAAAAVRTTLPEAPAAMAVAGLATVRTPGAELVAATARLSWKAALLTTVLPIARLAVAPTRMLPRTRVVETSARA